MTGIPSSLSTALKRVALAARLALGLCLLGLLLVAPVRSDAADDTIGDGLPLTAMCHTSTAVPAASRDHDMPGGFFCGGQPENYQHRSLWLEAGVRSVTPGGRTPVLMVHSSRFDRLEVGFRYADGAIAWQGVHSGDFSGHWRLGGQIGFAAPMRDVRLTGVVLRFDHLASAEVLRMRLVPSEVSDLQTIALASLIGAALMLLIIGAIYNFALGIAARRVFPILQAVWSVMMALWGTIWSQLHLFFVPWMAGTLSSQVDTMLALALLMLTALSLISALEAGKVPRWLNGTAVGLAFLVGLLGLPLGLMRSGAIDQLAMAVAVLFSVLVVVIVICLAVAWRRGSSAAHAFAGAWLVPLLAMSLTGFFNLGDVLWGGGEQMLVLLSGAWQTVWLSIAATRRFNLLRTERDAALASEALAHDQARHDALTGLTNRRGFVERIAPLLSAHAVGAKADDGDGALALLLLDIDQFKAVNDKFGHDVGDSVLVTISQRLHRWDAPAQVVARLGGEEFAVMVAGMGLFAARALAESMRQAIAACDHGDAIGTDPVTISIGLVMARPGDTFATLYRAADAALYAAKHQGRNRVNIGYTAPHDAREEPPPAQAERG